VTTVQEDPQLLAPPQDSRPFIARHWRALTIVLIILALLTAFVLYLRTKQPVAAPPRGRNGQNGPVSVSVATAVSGDVQVNIPALGTVTPLATVTVRTQIIGTLQRIFFTEGQFVHQGDALAQIDPRPYEAALQQMEGNLKRDQALLADARLDLTRYENLVKEDSIAQQQLDTQRALVDQYVGTIEADEGQVKTAQVNLVYTHITAPVTGRVGLRQVDQGNYVTPGDTNGIVLLNQLQPITVIFTIPEDNVPAVMKRLHAGATLTVGAFDRTNATKIADGNLLTVDNSIDVTTGTVKLRAQFDNADSALFPNQFVNVQLLVDVLHDQVIMPNAAVRRGAPNGCHDDLCLPRESGSNRVSPTRDVGSGRRRKSGGYSRAQTRRSRRHRRRRSPSRGRASSFAEFRPSCTSRERRRPAGQAAVPGTPGAHHGRPRGKPPQSQ
jgi:multidrug efflux system membrane fusion protein